MNFTYDIIETPVGLLAAGADNQGNLVATAFGRLPTLRHRGPQVMYRKNEGGLREIRRWVEGYFTGRISVPSFGLFPQGTPFQRSVWLALQQIPFGETISYGDLAARIGHPAASRAVGAACGANPFCLVVPCHRVVGKNGQLTGFAFGEPLKRRLLDHEAAVRQVAA